MKNRFLLFALTTIVVFFGLVLPGRAQIVLKPNGQNAAPLRVKTLRAKAVIESAQFATTDLDLTFQNEQSARIEADFLYTLPDGAVVTDFAYFYGDERVVARIAEKKRAAAIYQHITTRMRDPALVEMVGKNTFRARIFPVMPNADLRVQIRFVQALPLSAPNAVTYTMPLRTEKSVKWDALSLDVQVVGLETGASVTNNFGLPLVVQGGSPHFGFSAQNYRTDKDLRVGVTLPPAPTQAHLLSARSGGQNGFFALAVSGKTRPALRGGSTYDVETAPLGNGLLVCGRYKNSGTAQVGGTVVRFESAIRPGNAAEKLWAALRIARLSGSEKNREAVVALSNRFTIPSKWTSWLAIPVEERKRYEDEKDWADLSVTGEKIAELIEQGRGGSQEVKSLRVQFDALCQKRGHKSSEELPYFISQYARNRTNRIAKKLAELRDTGQGGSREARKLQAQIAVSGKESGEDPEETVRYYLKERVQARLEQTGDHLVSLFAQGREGSQEMQRVRGHLEALCKKLGSKPTTTTYSILSYAQEKYREPVLENIAQGKERTAQGRKAWREFSAVCRAMNSDPQKVLNDVLAYRAEDAAQNWAAQTQSERVAVPGDDGKTLSLEPRTDLTPEQKQSLRARVERLAKAAKRDPKEFFNPAQETQRTYNLFEIRETRDKLRAATPNNKAQVEAISRLFLDEVQRARKRWGTGVPHSRPSYYFNGDYIRLQIEQIAARVETQQLDEQLASAPNATDIAALQARRDELTQLRARIGDPLIKVDAPRDARTVVAQMPGGDLLPLRWDAASQTWQARFDIPTYAAEGAYVVAVLIVRGDGTRESRVFRYNVDVTAPQGTAKVEKTETGALRLEVRADEDTARVVALLPGGETVMLTSSAPGRFFALAAAGEGTITFILTDRAHNRTTLVAEARTETQAAP